MEVTSVSPPASSRTKGDDLCVIDVTNVAMHSVALLISLCGLAGNGAVLCLLRLKNNNAGIFNVAMADFLFLLFVLPSALLFLVEDMSCSPIMSLVYVSFLFQLSMVSCYWAMFRLARITMRRDMKNLCKLCCCCDLPLRLLWMVWSTQYWAFFAVFTVIPTLTSLCPSHKQEHCRAALISMFGITLLLSAAPLVITRTIDIIKAKCGSQQQQPERRDIVIFLIVLFTLLLGLWIFLQQLGYIFVSSQVGFLLTCINSTIKPFIYFLVGSSWRPCSLRRCWRHCTVSYLRASLQRVFKDPEENTRSRNDAAMDTVI